MSRRKSRRIRKSCKKSKRRASDTRKRVSRRRRTRARRPRYNMSSFFNWLSNNERQQEEQREREKQEERWRDFEWQIQKKKNQERQKREQMEKEELLTSLQNMKNRRKQRKEQEEKRQRDFESWLKVGRFSATVPTDSLGRSLWDPTSKPRDYKGELWRGLIGPIEQCNRIKDPKECTKVNPLRTGLYAGDCFWDSDLYPPCQPVENFTSIGTASMCMRFRRTPEGKAIIREMDRKGRRRWGHDIPVMEDPIVPSDVKS